jgi:hypothetical protein
MLLRTIVAGLMLAGLLCACAVIDPVDNRADTISRSLAKTRNEAIFLNLVRASHDYPLSFVTISNVTPTLSNTSSVGLPTFLFGPHIPIYTGVANSSSVGLFTPGRDVIFNNTTASESTTVTSNFNVSTQETSTFYEGFLKPLDLQTLSYFIRQGYSREMLFWLFTDSFELSQNNHTIGFHYSPPDDYGCNAVDPKRRCFIDWVHLATLTGLTVEEKTKEVPNSAGGIGPSKGGVSEGGKTTTTTYARFCFNPVLAMEARALMKPSLLERLTHLLDVPLQATFGPNTVCGGTPTTPPWPPTDPSEPQPDILPVQVGPFTFRIVPRSAYGVFEFLGQLMKMQREKIGPAPDAYIPPGRDDVTEPPILATVHDDKYLITVLQNIGGNCFVHTWFNDGDYCVPEQAATTKRIFGLLAQLIAIQTAATDLSITPTVRIIE